MKSMSDVHDPLVRSLDAVGICARRAAHARLGADQAHRVRDPRRHRRRRRSDGASHRGIVEKHKLSPRPFIVVNKSGGAGAEGFLYVKDKKADAHTIIITLSNLFTTPLHTGVPFYWKDLTPVARLALDEFILWVNAESPYKTAKEYLAAVKARRAATG